MQPRIMLLGVGMYLLGVCKHPSQIRSVWPSFHASLTLVKVLISRSYTEDKKRGFYISHYVKTEIK